MQIELSAEDLRHLQVAMLTYAGDRRHMARVMDDGRYLNDLPWVQAFQDKIASLRKEVECAD